MDVGMTMVFAVSDPKILTTVKAGDRIKFDAERVNGQLTVTRLQKAR
jgi:Cu/Ag efflux protein CusF